MFFEGLLPIGSVVLLKGAQKRLMIIGVCRGVKGENKVWDYAACPYPEGYISSQDTVLFNSDSIDKVYAIGFQDSEQFEFKVKADATLKKFREE